MQKQNHIVHGYIQFPIEFGVFNSTREEAMAKAQALFNSHNIAKFEIDYHTKDEKCHYIIVDKNIQIEWLHVDEE